MKKLLNYLPFYFLICLIIGLILEFYNSFVQQVFLFFTPLLLIVFFILIKLKKRLLVLVFSCFLFVTIGCFSVYIHNPTNKKNYYKNNNLKNVTTVLTIQKVLKSGNYYHKFVAKVNQINSKKTLGNILINIKKDSSYNLLKIDDRIFTKPEFKNLIHPLNPYEFDYKDYLAKQYIYQQIFINNNEYKLLERNKTTLFGLSEKFRTTIQQSLKKYRFENDELSVINALLLGQRQDISKNLLQNYTSAGAIHILAISGLHIGIILLILLNLLKPLEHLKYGTIIKPFLIIILLWMFAFIAGLSASVVRAVTMFTFVAIGSSFKKKKVIEYSLISSMFVLLLIKPLFLFNVGFQLSYLAVFGIVWIQPLLYKYWTPKYRIIDKFWQLTTVSVAAQVGILPISLYYFHQFPGLFIASNLIIIPFLGGILFGGIIIILLASFNILPSFLAEFYELLITLMNSVVSWIASKEEFLIQEISMSFQQMIIWYLVIIFSYQYFISKKTRTLFLLLSSIIILQVNFIFQKKNKLQKEEFIVFHKSRNSLLGLRKGTNFNVFHSLNNEDLNTNKSIKAYRIHEDIKSNFTTKIPDVFHFNSNTILCIDSLPVYKLNLKTPILILRNSPKINLKRVINTLNPSYIIADGSNYKSYINRWKATSKNKKTPFHYTGQNGAFIIKKND